MDNVLDCLTSWPYPGGELGVRATKVPKKVLARVQSNEDLVRLVMFLSATCDEERGQQVEQVFLPYLPYARQDRVAVEGDPNAVRALAKVLASTGVQFWQTLDVHSPASRRAFLERGCVLDSLSPAPHIRSYIQQVAARRELFLVAPDDGAVPRVAELAKELADLAQPQIIHCGKVRDSITGKLTGFEFRDGPETVSDRSHLMIIDDICDGGGTFHGVAAALSSRYGGHVPLHLWTTHGIYSKGLDALSKVFVTLGSTNSFLHGQTHSRLFTINI